MASSPIDLAAYRQLTCRWVKLQSRQGWQIVLYPHNDNKQDGQIVILSGLRSRAGVRPLIAKSNSSYGLLTAQDATEILARAAGVVAYDPLACGPDFAAELGATVNHQAALRLAAANISAIWPRNAQGLPKQPEKLLRAVRDLADQVDRLLVAAASQAEAAAAERAVFALYPQHWTFVEQSDSQRYSELWAAFLAAAGAASRPTTARWTTLPTYKAYQTSRGEPPSYFENCAAVGEVSVSLATAAKALADWISTTLTTATQTAYATGQRRGQSLLTELAAGRLALAALDQEQVARAARMQMQDDALTR